MAKYDIRKLSSAQREHLLRVLEQAVMRMRDAGAVRELFSYLLTPSELAMLGRRLLIARALLSGKTYLEIRRDLGVGLSTVEFVDRWLRATVQDYRYGDPQKRRHARRKRYEGELRRRIAREGRSRRPSGIFWLNRALGAELLPY